MDIKRSAKKYIVLREAAQISGYSSDYIGWLIRKGKIKGTKIYSGISWKIPPKEIMEYCYYCNPRKKIRNLDYRDSFLINKKYLSLQEAAKLSGYTPDYIGYLIRSEKINGEKFYSSISWVTTEKAIRNYQKKKREEKIFPSLTWQIKQTEIPLRVSKYGLVFAVLGLIIFSGVVVWAFSPKNPIQTAKIYPLNIESDWQNPKNVLGPPEVGAQGNLNSFSETNSAVYQNGPLTLILSDFKSTQVDLALQEQQQTEEPSYEVPVDESSGEVQGEELTEEQAEEEELIEELTVEEEIIEEPVIDEIETEPEIETEIIEEEIFQEESDTEEPIAENGGISLFEVIKERLRNNFVRAEEIPAFEELTTKEFLSAKIKFSFAIGEKEPDLQILEQLDQEEVIDEQQGTSSEPISFWRRIKNFFGTLLVRISSIARAENEKEILQNLDAKIIIYWSLDGEEWQILDTISQYPLSNALNDGYFSYEAPFLENWEDVKNLKIKFEGVIGGETNVMSYLDGFWLEVEYQEKEEEEEFELRVLKQDWRADEEPEFEIVSKDREENESIVANLIANISSIFEEKPKVKANLIKPDNKELELQEEEEFSAETHSPTKIKIFKTEDFQPGLHRLKVDFEKDGKVYNLEEDFTWGVLAINLNKSIYTLADEEVYLQFGVLDDRGHTICDARLEARIWNLESGIETVLSTENGGIQYSGECSANNVTDMPDYFAYFEIPEIQETFQASGFTFQVELTAHTYNGTRTITDSFEVREYVPFDVERIGPTRIYPAANYEMRMIIKANQDFEGRIKESVPEGFEIVPDNLLISEIHRVDEFLKVISWDVNWKAGEEYELRYQFDAPDISPYLYLVGPLEIGAFQEIRQWQIAADAPGPNDVILLWDGSSADVPTGWNCISCSPGDQFYGVFPRASSTYASVTSSADTHTHTVSNPSNTGASASIARSIGTGNTGNPTSHTHTVTSFTSNSGDHNPLFKNLLFIKAATTTLPQGVIGIFDIPATSSLPANWEYYSAIQDRYLRGGENTTSTGGAETHTHSTGDLIAPLSSQTQQGAGTVAGPVAAVSTHTHSITSFNLSAASNTPPFIKVVFAKATTANSIPDGLLAFFDATPLPTNWNQVSSSTFMGKFLVSSNSAGSTGGSATHTHATTTADSADSIDAVKISTTDTFSFAAAVHKHTFSFTTNPQTSLPVYRDVILGKYSAPLAIVSVSGTVYVSEGGANIGSGKDIQLRLDGGGTYSTTTDANGGYSISNIIGGLAGSTITVWINGDPTYKGTAVTILNSGNQTINDLDIYAGAAIVRSDRSATAITIADIADCDKNSCNDTDIHFTATTTPSTAFNIDNDSELHIWDGDTFAPGGTVTTSPSGNASAAAGDIHIDGTAVFNVGTNAVSCGGDWILEGTFTKSPGQIVTFTATSTGFSINNATSSFANVIFNGSGGGWSLATSTTIDANVTTTEGSLELNSKNLWVNGGTISGTDGSITCSGCTAGTTTLSSAGNLGPTGAGSYTFYNLTLSGGTILIGNININKVLTISSGNSLDASEKTINLYGSGTDTAKPFVIEGTFIYNQSTVVYRGLAATDITSATYYNLTASSTGVTFTLTGNTTTTNNLNITAGTLDVTANDYTLWMGGNWTNSGTFNAQKGEVVFNATTTGKTINPGGSAFYNLTFNGVGGGWTFSADATTSNNLNLTNGTVTSTPGILYVGGDWNATTTATFYHNEGEVIFYATSTSHKITDGGWPFYLLTFNGENGEWLYQDSTSTAPATTTVIAGTPTFLNAKTGNVEFIGGTLNVDWYLGIHVVAADSTSTDIGNATATISEATGSSTVWIISGSSWGAASPSQITMTGSEGKNPQPNDNGAIRIREYSRDSASTSYYKYNLEIEAAGFIDYNYYVDYDNNYLTSTSSPETENVDKVIWEGWQRDNISQMNTPYPAVNEPPTNGSWYAGLTSDFVFSVDDISVGGINLGFLNELNTWTATGTTILSATTSYPGGYTIKAWATNEGELRFDSNVIIRWPYANSTPAVWPGTCEDSTECGFGHTTGDTTLWSGTDCSDNRFDNGNKYAGFATSSQDIAEVARSCGPVPAGEDTTITYRVSAPRMSVPGLYEITIYYIASVNY